MNQAAQKTNKQTQVLRLYTPHEKQLEMHNSKARFKVAAFGRQSGKSTWGNQELLKRAWETPSSHLWFISPTFDQAKIQYRRLVASLWDCREILIKKNQTELRVKLSNQSSIMFKSGEVFDNLRSDTLTGVIIDEVRDQHPDLWPMVIRPMLTTTKGWAAFIGTPNGFDHFYDLFNYAQLDQTGTWQAFQAPSTCNPLITEDEVQDAKRTMSEAQFAQEYLAEFRDLTSGKAYINFGEWNLRKDSPIYQHGLVHPQLPIVIGMDFNLSPMAWSLGQKKVDDFYWFDEVWLKGSHTQEAAKVLCEKIISYNHQKVGVILAGDATSKSGQRAAAGQSDYDIICQALDQHNIKWINVTPDSNPNVKDRVNNMNAKLKDATGSIHLWVHPTNCPMLARDLQRVVWKQSASGVILDQTSNTELTHSSDGVGYAIHALSPLKYDAALPTLRVIMR